jgi:hypothetical protein
VPGVDTATPVAQKTVFGLATYLITASVLTGYAFVGLWSAQPQLRSGTAPAPACAADPKPKLTNVYPDRVNAGAADVLAIGCNFPSTSTVKLNGTAHQALFVDTSHIRVALTAADTAAPGAIVITLSDKNSDYGSGAFNVVTAVVYWTIFGRGPWSISGDVQLLLLALTMGAFGSAVYALKSLADYRGDNKLFTSWITLYIVQPFEGAGIAVLLYLVLRAGFLGTSGDPKAVN